MKKIFNKLKNNFNSFTIIKTFGNLNNFKKSFAIAITIVFIMNSIIGFIYIFNPTMEIDSIYLILKYIISSSIFILIVTNIMLFSKVIALEEKLKSIIDKESNNNENNSTNIENEK